MANYTANSNNVGQLQNALKNLEDRCQKLQRRTDTLQAENERLLAGRAELLAEVERLQEQQIRLRERNLRLTQEFHAKQQECSLLAEKLTMFARGRVQTGLRKTLTELKEDAEGSVDSLNNTQDDLSSSRGRETVILTKSKRTLSEPNLSVIQRELDQVRKGLWTRGELQEDSVEKISSNLLSSLKKEQNELEEQFTRIVTVQKSSLDVVQELNSNSLNSESVADGETDSQLTELARSTRVAVQKLQAQQFVLKKLHDIWSNKQKSADSGTSVVTQTSIGHSETLRVCPLCELDFPSTVSQESFEDHVMEHFSNEGCILPDFEIIS